MSAQLKTFYEHRQTWPVKKTHPSVQYYRDSLKSGKSIHLNKYAKSHTNLLYWKDRIKKRDPVRYNWDVEKLRSNPYNERLLWTQDPVAVHNYIYSQPVPRRSRYTL
jgi:hypothetical protein